MLNQVFDPCIFLTVTRIAKYTFITHSETNEFSSS